LLELYTINYLNQYTFRNVTERDDLDTRPTPTPRPRPSPTPRPTPPGQQAAAYGYAGNMTNGFDGSTYQYDAQNRLLSTSTNGTTMSFEYDGLNRQVRRSATNQPDTFNVWDGWDLIEEYQSGGSATAFYLYGADGLIASAQVTANQFNYYYQDGSGNTSYIADANGDLKELYRYDLQGAPTFYDADDNQLSASARNVRHLFTGQQWYNDIGLYDMRNRFYSPDIGRFLQPDPIGFRGGNNLYRYCGNNPVTRWDPFGLQVPIITESKGTPETERVTVVGRDPETVGGGGGPGGGGGGGGEGGGGHGLRGRLTLNGLSREYVWPARNSNSNTLQNPPAQNPPSSNRFGSFGVGPPGIFTIDVATVIENGLEPGLKSFQRATVNVLGEVVAQDSWVGFTYNPFHGTYERGHGLFAAYSSTPPGMFLPSFNVTMQGHATSALLPAQLSIDYEFNINVNLASGMLSVSGMHDGYPSYTVTVNGETLYYFHEHFFGDLLEPMDVFVGGGR